MKKILYASLALVAGLMMASCQQEHIEVVYDPANVSDQTLQSIQGTELSADGPDVTTTFNAADFKIDVATIYNLYAAASQDMTDKVKMTAAINLNDEGTRGTISMAQKDLNSMVYNLGGVADTPFTIYFQLGAGIASDKNTVIASTEHFSNVVGASFTPYSTTIKDADLYEHVWVIGAGNLLGAWSHDKVFQFLYDYGKDGNTFTGLIDMGDDHSSNQFKLTGAADWSNDTGNWGVAAGAADEGDTIQLENGSNDNITQYTAKRFYFFSFNKASLVLTKSYSFDNVGIVGAFNGWNAADANLKMTYNPYFHRFWIDYAFAEETELKFTCDDAWNLNWGVDCAPGGGNISVAPGNYRIYLDLNKGEFDFNTSMFGKDEPAGEEEPDVPAPAFEGWSLIGDFNGWGGDVDMTEADGVWTGYFTNTAKEDGSNGGFKIRKDHDWALSVGGTFTALDVAFDAVSDNGPNIEVPAGFYKVVYDTAAQKITVSDGEVWSLIGDFNGWGGDVDMAKDGSVWIGVFTNTAKDDGTDGGFKIRHNHDWALSVGGTFEEFGKPFSAVSDNGPNIAVPAGAEYKVSYDTAAQTITVEPSVPGNLWAVIGAVGGTAWNKDFYMSETDGIWVSEALEFAADSEFKLRFNNSWADADCIGGAEDGIALALGQAITPVHPGKNLKVAEAGTYTVIYDTNKNVVFLQGWALIGAINGTSWNRDFYMTVGSDGLWWSDEVEINTEFKIRRNSSWADADTRGLVSGDVTVGTPFKVTGPGSNISVPAGKYTVSYNPASEEATVHGAGEVPAGEGIKTADEFLAWLADGSKDAQLAADIDLSGKTLAAAAEIAGGLDGKGHTITVKDLATPVLPVVKGDVKDLVFAGSFVAVPGADKMVLAPIGKSYGKLEKVINKATVTLNGPAGQGVADTKTGATLAGVVGEAYGPLKDCKNEAKVAAEASGKDTWTIIAAGVAGVAGAALEGCVNSGEVSLVAGSPLGRTKGLTEVKMKYDPVSSVAGVVAYAVSDADHAVTVTDCSNSAKISFVYDNLNAGSAAVSRSPVAGVVANSGGDITNCHNTGDIYASMNATDRSAAYSAQNIILHAAGIQGSDYFVTKIKASADQNETSVIGCTNSGNIYVDTDMTKSNNAVGGISGWPSAEAASITVIKDCVNSGNISMKGLGKIRIGGIAGGSNSIEGCKNTGDITVENSDSGSVFGLVNGFHTQTHALKNTEASGRLESKVKVTGLGGLCGGIGNAENTLGEGCKVNASIVSEATPQCGLIVGTMNGKTKKVTVGTAESPVTVAGSVNGTEASAENFMSLIHNASNYSAEYHTFNVVFGK